MVLFAGKGEVCEKPEGVRKLKKNFTFTGFLCYNGDDYFAEEQIHE
jgi:hypothetical protein